LAAHAPNVVIYEPQGPGQYVANRTLAARNMELYGSWT
jgi:hypothetical protein